jgi:hypothetical protein
MKGTEHQFWQISDTSYRTGKTDWKYVNIWEASFRDIDKNKSSKGMIAGF